jgi:hypothetical protein
VRAEYSAYIAGEQPEKVHGSAWSSRDSEALVSNAAIEYLYGLVAHATDAVG